MATLITDDFNRADSNTVGGGWTESEAAAVDLSIASNELKVAYSVGSGASPLAYQSHGTITLPATLSFKVSPGTDTRGLYVLAYSDTSTSGAGGGNGIGVRVPCNGNSANNASIVIPGNSSVSLFTIDTTSVKYIWIDYTDGGGTIDVAVYVNTSASKPGSSTATTTGVTVPANSQIKVTLDGGASTNYGLVDDILLSDASTVTFIPQIIII